MHHWSSSGQFRGICIERMRTKCGPESIRTTTTLQIQVWESTGNAGGNLCLDIQTSSHKKHPDTSLVHSASLHSFIRPNVQRPTSNVQRPTHKPATPQPHRPHADFICYHRHGSRSLALGRKFQTRALLVEKLASSSAAVNDWSC
jgi:hypothetical protein